jgi:hypothetical protein
MQTRVVGVCDKGPDALEDPALIPWCLTAQAFSKGWRGPPRVDACDAEKVFRHSSLNPNSSSAVAAHPVGPDELAGRDAGIAGPGPVPG